MRKRLGAFWENYKFRFVPWIIMNLKQNRKTDASKTLEQIDNHTKSSQSKVKSYGASDSLSVSTNGAAKVINTGPSPVECKIKNYDPVIVQHVDKGDDKLISDKVLLKLLINLFENFSNNVSQCSKRNQEVMHNLLGYSIDRRKSKVSADAGTGVFLASGRALPGSLIALYPGTVYMPSEPLFFPSIANPFIFRCSDGVHIDGNDKWISKSIFKSCAARDKFRHDLPCCDESWLTPTPLNSLSIGQYVNNRSRSAENNVVYQESTLRIAMSLSSSSEKEFPVHLCKYLPNVWANPANNQMPLRLVPLVAVKTIEEGDEILSSYFTLVHSKQGRESKDEVKR